MRPASVRRAVKERIMPAFDIVFKWVTEQVIIVPIQAEDYDEAWEKACALVGDAEGQPQTLAEQTQQTWSPQRNYLDVPEIFEPE